MERWRMAARGGIPPYLPKLMPPILGQGSPYDTYEGQKKSKVLRVDPKGKTLSSKKRMNKEPSGNSLNRSTHSAR
jgi:hypothetical protein